jgi:hypothetical protein
MPEVETLEVESPAETPAAEPLLSEAALDARLAEQQAAPPSEPSPAQDEWSDAAMSDDELQSLLDAAAGKAPVPAPAPAAKPNDFLQNLSDLDSMLAENASPDELAAAGVPASEPVMAPIAAEIEDLIASHAAESLRLATAESDDAAGPEPEAVRLSPGMRILRAVLGIINRPFRWMPQWARQTAGYVGAALLLFAINLFVMTWFLL